MAGVKAAQIGELQQIFRRTLGVGAAVDQHGPAGNSGHNGGHGRPPDAPDALGDKGRAGQQRAGGAGGDKGVSLSVPQQRQPHTHGGVLLAAEYRGGIILHGDLFRGGHDVHPLRQRGNAALGQRLPDGSFIPGQGDVHTPALLSPQRTLDDSQRRVVAAHCVYNDPHVESTSSRMASMMASERWLSSAFLLRFPFTR